VSNLDYDELLEELEEAKLELEEHALEPEHQEETEGVWLISYADLMTLLMGFFALMTSMGTFEEEKFNAVAEQIAEFTGGEIESSYQDLSEELKKIIDQKNLSESVEVEANKANLVIHFKGQLLFGSGSFSLKEEANALMDEISKTLQSKASDKKVLIEGHTDNIPINRGIIASNWELSSLRANAIARLFEINGFQKEQILTIGFGETRPYKAKKGQKSSEVDVNARNRRVVVKIMNKLPF